MKKQVRQKHKYVGTPTYVTWYNMKSRCDNPTYTNFSKWGGRGITYDKKWKTFLGFLEDMGERPENMSLDRIDNNGNYTKENCRWATRKQQANNASYNRMIKAFGKYKTLQQWSDEMGIDRKTISNRIDKRNWAVEKALTVKPNYNHGNHNYYANNT